LVYNAAYAPIGLVENFSEEQLSMFAKVNVKGPLLLSRLLSAEMIKNRRGGIVLMSSLAGGQGCPKLAGYAATKAFNAVLAEGLWAEMRPYGIDVIACCAGGISTPGYQKAGNEKLAPGTMPPEQVVEQTLKALGKGPGFVAGGINRFARFLMKRIISRRVAIEKKKKNTGGLS
jgi:short-subunit dehydrogenase